MVQDSKKIKFQLNELGMNLREPSNVIGYFDSIEKYN